MRLRRQFSTSEMQNERGKRLICKVRKDELSEYILHIHRQSDTEIERRM